MRSPNSATRSSSCAGWRAVATTRSPASRAARARARPRPREEPVMNQVCSMASSTTPFLLQGFLTPPEQWETSTQSAGSVALGKLRALRTECVQVSLEHRFEESGVVYARGADHLSQLQATQTGSDDVLGGHAGHGTEVQTLTLVELGRDKAGADNLDRQPVG